MNLRDLVVPALTAFFVLWAFNTWFSPKEQLQYSTNKEFIAPESVLQARMLNTSINCLSSTSGAVENEPLSLQTDIGTYYLDTRTGSIKEFTTHVKQSGRNRDFLQEPNALCQVQPLSIVLADDQIVEFTHYEIRELEQARSVTFHNSAVGIEKQLIFYNDKHQVDLILNTSAAFDPQIARVVLPSIGDRDASSTTTVVSRPNGGISVTPVDKLETQKGWIKPSIFGVASRYFTHVLFVGNDEFVQRGYYAKRGETGVIGIIEGELAPESNVWLSYYMGPRQAASLAAVDPSLSGLSSSSGYLSALVDAILYILNWFTQYTGNMGWAFIFLVLLIRIFMYPFTTPPSDLEGKRVEMDRRLKYIQTKYKDDSERLSAERMKLISKNGVPGGMTMIMASLMELPLFIAIRSIIANSFEFYQSPFLWIGDLGSPDPYYILPLLMILVLLLQALSGPNNGRMFKLAFALLMLTVIPKLSAGLVLYFVVSMGLRASLPIVVKKAKKVSFA